MITSKALAISFFVLAPACWGQSLAGLWDATILDYNGHDIPFKMEISGNGSDVKGWFFNGTAKEVSNRGKFENGVLTMDFDSYAAHLKATYKDGVLTGEYGPVVRKMTAIRAVRASQAKAAPAANVPNIGGTWDLTLDQKSSKGEDAWNLILNQKGADVAGAILRVDGDTGELTGSYKDGKFTMSHFDGSRPSLMILTPMLDKSLKVELASLRGFTEMKAVRPEVAKAQGLPMPTDADAHTNVKDAKKPFSFSFPDLNGKIISNTDARFEGKVVLVVISGSWCPNCHDEAPYLEQAYEKYKDRGLEVVALSFEEGDQLTNPTRLKAFIEEYGIKYTVLVCGEPDQAKEKLTQAQNWDAWPTTFFVGRDGLVKYVHAGFAGPASGEMYKKESAEFLTRVEQLLVGNKSAKR
jgi:peroxiredoxin